MLRVLTRAVALLHLAPAHQEVRWDEGVRQPVNAFSNLPFALTGAHMLALGVADARAWRRRAAEHTELERFPLFSLANGAAQLWVAVGSLLFHGSWTRAGQRADMGAVYTVLLCPAAYVAQRLGLLGPGAAHGPFGAVVLATAAGFTVQKWRLKSSRMVPALIALLAALQALWFCVGSPPSDAGGGAAGGGGLKRWLWGPLQRRRPEGLAWPLLAAAAVSIAVAFGASRAYCCCLCACKPGLLRLAAPLTGCTRAQAAPCATWRAWGARRAAGFSGTPPGTRLPLRRCGCSTPSSAANALSRPRSCAGKRTMWARSLVAREACVARWTESVCARGAATR